MDYYGINIGNIKSYLDDGGSHKHIDLSFYEIGHNVFQLILVHLAMGISHSGIRHQRLNLCCHVCDLAEGHLAALDWTLKQTGCEQVNLGTGHGTSVLELVAAFERATGRRVPYRIAPRRPGDIASGYAATDKAEQLLGWRAKRDIDDMCRDGWNFTKSRFDIK